MTILCPSLVAAKMIFFDKFFFTKFVFTLSKKWPRLKLTCCIDRTTTLPPVQDSITAAFLDTEANKTYIGTVTGIIII